MVPKEVFTGLAALTALLIVGAVYGRLYGSDQKAIKDLGDRIMSGLLALPLIGVLTHLTFPDVHIGWALLVPLPMAFYLFMLAGTGFEWGWCKEGFLKWLLIVVGLMYGAMAGILLLQAA